MKIVDAAKHIIYLASKDNYFSLTPLKLQKLLYYSQGFSYVWYNQPIFKDEFEAWQYGPVNREIYNKYKKYGQNRIPSYEGEVADSLLEEIDVLESVWDNLKRYSAFDLVKMTHKEEPWIKANRESNVYIDNESIRDYFKRAYS